MKYDEELAFAKDLAHEAGKIMRRYFRAEDIGIEWKDDNTPLTVADTKINDLVIKRVKSKFPTHGVFGEESSYQRKRDMIWVVDPIDGTAPFSLGMPVSTFSLALVDRSDGQPVLGVAYDPYLDHLYHARRGEGSFLNDKSISASQDTDFFKGYISLYGKPVQTKSINYRAGDLLEELRSRGAKLINIASGVYNSAKIASGEFTLMVEIMGAPWDTAAAAIIVEEAGGKVSDLEGKKRRFDDFALGCIIAANRDIHEQFMQLIRTEGNENPRH